MSLSNLLMTAYVNKASEAGTGVWDILEKVAREHLTEELYRAASGLFDEASDVKDLDEDEYVRGMAEVIADLTGDDKYAVVAKIRAKIGAYELTSKDFVEDRNGDLIYIGPLQIAIDFIKGPNKATVEVFRPVGGGWRIELDEGNVFGQADTQELAWRYALGAEFGPLDENFVPFMLHR